MSIIGWFAAKLMIRRFGTPKYNEYQVVRRPLGRGANIAVQRIGTTRQPIRVILHPDGRQSSQFQLTLLNGGFAAAAANATKYFPAHKHFRVVQAPNASLTISGPITPELFRAFVRQFPKGACVQVRLNPR